MAKKITIAAFGALNPDSYDEFSARLAESLKGVDYTLQSAAPYPNAQAVSEPGRPLRGEALQDEGKKQELFKAVAGDGMAAGAADAQILVMPCMSMIGFHDGVEKALGRKILRLSDALAAQYKDVPKLGVIHMRPAKQRIVEIFGDRAVTPDDAQAAKLLAAEEELKRAGNSAPVESVMKEIVEDWKAKGITHILFARADAPKAKHGNAGTVPGVTILSYFDVLANYVAQEIAKPAPAPNNSVPKL
ncbi:MAG: hypothetical protein JNM12_03515 [Alphaproteobacteria bacterium]|nr:hypothetical protein [Alphaproteobacteria bacterium]